MSMRDGRMRSSRRFSDSRVYDNTTSVITWLSGIVVLAGKHCTAGNRLLIQFFHDVRTAECDIPTLLFYQRTDGTRI
jgi:hypothetical protein